MKNSELAALFAELATLLEYQGENPFKLNAYRKAARVLGELTEDVAVLAREQRLRELEGIGEAIAKKIAEYLDSGRIGRLEEARAAVPPGILDVLRVPGLGPKTAAQLNKALGITNLQELEAAARAGRIRVLPGLGLKKEQNLLRGLDLIARSGARLPLGSALPLAELLLAQLATAGVKGAVFAGSLRRMKETVGDLDVLVASAAGAQVVRAFCRLPAAHEILAEGPTKGSVFTAEGRQIDLRVVEPDAFGAALQYFTGSKEHNIRLRDLAKRDGLKINEYGVFRGEVRVAGDTEESVYAALGLPWIAPELREDRGELDAALAGRLPKLLEPDDLRGDLHVHTDWSDGHASLEAMAAAAKARGYEYLVISDHSRALKVFGGLTEERLREQVAAIAALNRRKPGLRVLTGLEVDIRGDGTLDLPDAALAELDFVTASVHSGLGQGREPLTARILSAMRNPHVDSIGHLSGRLLGRREPCDLDVDAILAEAARTETLVEVNLQPDRLDLCDTACRRAKELGVKLVINTDAHSPEQLDYMRFGVATARRGWLEKSDVLNTQPLRVLLKWLGRET